MCAGVRVTTPVPPPPGYGIYILRPGLRNQVRNQANFGPVKGLKKFKEKQRNQNFTKESEKIVIRKLRYRKDSYSKTGVQRKMLVFPKKYDFGLLSRYQLVISTFQRQK